MSSQDRGETAPLEHIELTPAERSQLFVADFYEGLVDGRGFIEEQLGKRASHSYSCDNYWGQISNMPDDLADRLGMGAGLRNGSTMVSISLAFSVQPDTEDRFRLDFMRMQPEDGEEVVLANEDPLTNLSRGDGSEYFMGNMLSEALRSILPSDKPSVTDEDIALAVFALSPTSRHSMEVRNGSAYLLSTSTETTDDSLHAIDVHAQYQHPSNKTVVLRSSVEETLAKASCGIGIEASRCLSLGAGMVIVCDEVVDGKIVTVKTPRRLHAMVLRGAIEQMLEESQASDNSIRSPWQPFPDEQL